MEPQNWVAHRKHGNEAFGAQESTVRGQAGTERGAPSNLERTTHAMEEWWGSLVPQAWKAIYI